MKVDLSVPAREPAVTPPATTLALKRMMDIAGSAIGLVVLSPVLLVVATAIKLDSPGPVLFRQERVGRGGRPFRILKFRSMVADAERLGTALTSRGDRRITRVGAFLRKTKLDELPQLVNVLVGDMSLVGPRPEVPAYVAFYTPEQFSTVLSVRPGITDYASILFRDESALLDGSRDVVEVYRTEILPIKLAYYEAYCRHVRLVDDVRIIAATVSLLLFKHVPSVLGIDHELRLGARQS